MTESSRGVCALLILCRCPVGCLSGSFFAVAHDQPDMAITLQHAGAALLLVVSFLGWYIFISLILLSVEFPYVLPLGDLSTVIRSKPQKTEVEEQV